MNDFQLRVSPSFRVRFDTAFPGGFPGGSDGKESTCNATDMGSIPGLGRFPGGGNGNPPQYSCLEIPWTEDPVGLQSMGITKSRTCLSTHAQTIVNNTALHI